MLSGSLVGTAAGPVVSAADDAEIQDALPIQPVSGTWSFASGVGGDVQELVGGGTRETGATWTFEPLEVSDPRLDGPTVSTSTQDSHGKLSYIVNVVRLETNAGSWQQEPTWTIGSGPDSGVPSATIWVGEGPYEGLLLVAETTFNDGTISLDGHIIESDLPPLP